MPIEKTRPADHAAAGFRDLFGHPPRQFCPVPFYWWAGEKLERERVAWQLDQLRSHGVYRTVVSYPHLPEGPTDAGDPPVFSPAWWDFFRWFLTACRERGMTAGIQDYTIIGPVLQAIGRETPAMQGGQMSCATASRCGPGQVRLAAEAGALVIGAWACPLSDAAPCWEARIDLLESVSDGTLDWCAPAGEWWVVLVFARLNPFDPMHPEAGRLAIERLYALFERECPGEVGQTLDLFFQDELDFGSRMPFWSNQLSAAFLALKGYDLTTLLPALWHDLGPLSEKFRLDYADVVSRCIEQCYFEPVYRWHEERGTLLGHDNCGRGRVAEGRAHYGDYFRAMRWFSAPGCDDPKLQGPRAFKGLKVNSSIAHLYQRPRVWLEAFHSSGWGTRPAEILSALHEDFVCGANLVNPHGLYYSTRGAWWEWAPPDTHFRQPYWQHAASFQLYLTRMCWLLSQGSHRCDVALVYPTEALDAQPADPAFQALKAHTGNESIDAKNGAHVQPEETAFALGKFLFDHACDFDFVDAASLAVSSAGHGELSVVNARYRVLVLPAMAAVRHSTLEAALALAQAGGLVVAFACLPRATDRDGRDSPAVHDLLVGLFGAADATHDLCRDHPGGGRACYIRDDFSKVLQILGETMVRDVSSSVPLQVLHRHIDHQDLYFLFNPSNETICTQLRLRSPGAACQWDAWTGESTELGALHPLSLGFGPREAKLVIVDPAVPCRQPHAAASSNNQAPRTVPLDGAWQFDLVPTCDNRFGDFRLPGSDSLLGADARRFRYCDEFDDEPSWQSPAFDDSSWPETTFSFGPRLEFAGPFAPGSGAAANETEWLEQSSPGDWQPYGISLRWGIERDAHLTDWLSGPHGLKGQVPDEFLDFHSETPGSVWYVRAKVLAGQGGEVSLVTGARCAYQMWLNGTVVATQAEALEPGLHPPWNIPHYACTPLETRVTLRQGSNDLLLKLVQPAGQRTRAYFAFAAPPAQPDTLALRWFTDPSAPRPCLIAPATRRAIQFRFSGPPGLREITFTARGKAAVWVDGTPAGLVHLAELPDGCHRFRATLKTPAAASPVVAMRVEAAPDSHAGDALPEVIDFHCGPGTIETGDWCRHGLATYSGIGEYRRTLEFTEAELAGSWVTLELGDVAATTAVRVNGDVAATLFAPPWRVDLTKHLHSGANELVIAVANTLANHYSVGVPTPYAFPSQTCSGLLGPVRMVFSKHHE